MNYFDERNIANIVRLENILNCLPDFINEFFTGIENNTTALTRLNYAHDLRIFFDYLCRKKFKNKNISEISLADLEALTASDIEMFLSYLNYYKFNGKESTNSERGKARKLASVRTMFKYFYNREKLAKNVTAKVPLPKLHDKEIIRLDIDEIVKLLNASESGDGLTERQKKFHVKTSLRDTAILTLFLGTGIRISELVGLNVEDVNFDDNSFIVTRKGGNRVILYFSDEIASALKKYIEQRLNDEKTEKLKPLFLSAKYSRLCARAIENLVKKYAKIISPLKKISPHKLRSTYGTSLYRETKDIYVVAEVLGHKDVNTTKKHYAAISDDIRRDASNKVKLR